jgi:hypothetical protein
MSDRQVVAAFAVCPDCGLGNGLKCCRSAEAGNKVKVVAFSKHKEKALISNIPDMYACRFEYGNGLSAVSPTTSSTDGSTVTCDIPELVAIDVKWEAEVLLEEGGLGIASKAKGFPIVHFLAAGPVLGFFDDVNLAKNSIDKNDPTHAIHYTVDDADSPPQNVTVAATVSNTHDFAIEVTGQPRDPVMEMKITFKNPDSLTDTIVTVTATDSQGLVSTARTFRVSIGGEVELLVVEQTAAMDYKALKNGFGEIQWKSIPIVSASKMKVDDENRIVFQYAGTIKFDIQINSKQKDDSLSSTLRALRRRAGVDDMVITQEVMSDTGGQSLGGNIDVEAGDILVFEFKTAVNDETDLAGASVIFFPESSGVDTYIGRSEGGSVHNKNMQFTKYYHNTDKGRKVPLDSWLTNQNAIDGTAGFNAKRDGIFALDYHQDIWQTSYSYVTFELQITGTPDNAINQQGTYMVELVGSSSKWDGIRVSAIFPVQDGTRFQIKHDYSTNLDSGEWGPLSLLYLPYSFAASDVGDNKFETVFAELGNAYDGLMNANADERKAKFKELSTSNADVIKIDDEGDLLAVKEGIINFHYHQDIQHNCNDLKLMAVVGPGPQPGDSYETPSDFGVTYTREENGNTGGSWDGLSIGFSVPVKAGEKVMMIYKLDAGQCSIHAIEQWKWGRMSALWISTA